MIAAVNPLKMNNGQFLLHSIKVFFFGQGKNDYKSEDYQLRSEVAKNPKTSPEILDILATDTWIDIQILVASNPNTRKETLDNLSRHYDPYVRCKVSLNPTTSESTLRTLSMDSLWWIRHAVAKNPNTPEDVLDNLAKDSSPEVRYSVSSWGFKNKVSLQTLKYLTNDVDYTVRECAKSLLNIKNFR